MAMAAGLMATAFMLVRIAVPMPAARSKIIGAETADITKASSARIAPVVR